MIYQAAIADQSVTILITGTDGTDLNTVTHASAGLSLWYRREGEAKQTVTAASLAAIDSAHADGGIILIGNGVYRLDMPDAAFAATNSRRYVSWGGTVTDGVITGGTAQLVQWPPFTALPAAAAGTDQGVFLGGVSKHDADDLNDINGATVNSQVATALATYDPPTKTELDAGFAALNDFDPTSETVTVGTNNDKTGYSLTNLTVSASVTLAAGTHNPQTGDAYAYLGTNLGALGANATEAGGTGDQLTAVPWNSAWDAEVQSECTDALNAYDPPTKAELDSGLAALNDLSAAEVNAEVDAAIETYRLDELVAAAAAAPATGAFFDDMMTADEVAVEVWDEATASHSTAGTFGKLAVDNLDAAVSSRSTVTTAQVNAEVDTALADIHLDHLLAATYDPASKPGAADALLNELVESDSGVSRFTANSLEQAPTGSGASVDAIADAVCDELLAGHVISGSVGEALGRIDATVSSRSTVTTAQVNAECDTAISDASLATAASVAALNDISAGDVNTQVAAALATYDAATGTGLAALATSAEIAALNDLSAAQVNAEVDAAIETYRLDELIAAAASAPAADSVLADLTEDDGGVLRFNANALETAPTGSGATAAAIADAVWDEALADHDTAGSTGEQLASGVGSGGTTNVTLGVVTPSQLDANRTPNQVALSMLKGTKKTFAIVVYDSDGVAVDLTDKTLRFVVWNPSTVAGAFEVEAAGITISTNTASVPVTGAQSATAGDYRWALYEVDAGEEITLAWGPFTIEPAVTDM